MSDTLVLRLLRFLPRNLISRGWGWLARRERPRLFVRPYMRWFVRQFGLDLTQAERPFEDYPSLQALFTRRLREGLRPVATEPGVMVSPVDARVGAFGRIEHGRALQAKGMDYSVEDLLGSAEAAALFADGHYATLYLSPRDYHRIHAPVGGRVTRSLYEPGTLWPVNAPAVRTLPNLFAVNERVTSLLDTDAGPVAVSMVGATNVGSIRLAYTDLVCNRGAPRQTLTHEPAIEVHRGGDLGVFQLGSTVVLLVADPGFSWDGIEDGKWVAMGSVVGRHGS
jgi:phosphatidylserine decarboxylase